MPPRRLIGRAKRTRTAIRYPATTPLDDYPLVPCLIDDARTVHFDSTGIARWIDDHHPAPAGLLIPEDSALRFVSTLIDEAFDEGRALWDGVLLGRPFRHVVKTFQVQVWRELEAAWDALAEPARARVRTLTGGAAPLTPAQDAGGIE